MQTIRSGGSLTKKLYLAGFEQTEVSTNLVAPAWSHVETRVFVATPMGTIGIHVQDGSENVERRYLHRDHLGSVVAVTGEPSGGTAPLLAEYSFDAWGVHRDASDWSPISVPTRQGTAWSPRSQTLHREASAHTDTI